MMKTDNSALEYVVFDAHENQMTAYPNLKRELRFFPVENDSPKALSREQVDSFNRDGFLTGLTAYDTATADRHRAAFERLLEAEIAKGHGSYSMDGWQHKVAEIYDLVMTPAILDHIEDLLGPNILCWGTHYFCKLPGDGKLVSWHQDASFWPLTPSKCATVWLAIDDASVENGCMRVVPGSHLHGQIAFRKSKDTEGSVLNQTVDNISDYGRDPVDIELKAGQFSIHTDLLLHGSNPNTSKDRRRCGITLRFIPADVASPPDWRKGETLLCRGEDVSGTWTIASRPAV